MNQEKIWEAYQNDDELVVTGWPSGGRYEFLVKRVPQGSRVLNIGVGSGRLEELLVQKGVDVHCLDPSTSSIETLRKKLGLGNKAQAGYSQSMPFADGTFDRVVMSEVLEHLDDDVLAQTLAEVVRVLQAGGCFMGTVPADEDLQASLVVCPHCGERFHRWGHLQCFSQERLSKALKCHFDDVSVRRVFLGDFKQLNWKGKISGSLKALQAALGKSGSNQNFYFEARKA